MVEVLSEDPCVLRHSSTEVIEYVCSDTGMTHEWDKDSDVAVISISKTAVHHRDAVDDYRKIIDFDEDGNAVSFDVINSSDGFSLEGIPPANHPKVREVAAVLGITLRD